MLGLVRGRRGATQTTHLGLGYDRTTIMSHPKGEFVDPVAWFLDIRRHLSHVFLP